MTNLLRLHSDALTLADRQVSTLRPDDLELPTPCAGWSLGELLAHMIGQHHGFAQAVREHTAPADAYRPVPFEPSVWQDSVRALRDAFATADPHASAVAVELTPTPLPIEQLVAAQLLDTVVHTWDIAASVGAEFRPPDELLAATAAIAEAIPDRAFGPGHAFAVRLTVEGDAWQRTLALVGREISASVPTGRG